MSALQGPVTPCPQTPAFALRPFLGQLARLVSRAQSQVYRGKETNLHLPRDSSQIQEELQRKGELSLFPTEKRFFHQAPGFGEAFLLLKAKGEKSQQSQIPDPLRMLAEGSEARHLDSIST